MSGRVEADRDRWRHLATWVTTAALLAAVVAVAQHATTADRRGAVDAVTVPARTAQPSVSAVAERFERLERLTPTGTVTALNLGVVVVAMTLAGLIGPARRRIGDVGDRWRRLLLGAPPAAV